MTLNIHIDKTKPIDKTKLVSAYYFSWTEYERGWGQRPDGVSLHASCESAEAYLKEFNSKKRNDGVPDEYSSPDFEKPREVFLPEDLALYLKHCDVLFLSPSYYDTIIQNKDIAIGLRESANHEHLKEKIQKIKILKEREDLETVVPYDPQRPSSGGPKAL